MTKIFELSAGRLCLNFCNTVDERPGFDSTMPGAPTELLNNYDEFLDWCEGVKLCNTDLIEALRSESKKKPEEAKRTLERAKNLREMIFALLLPLTSGEQVLPVCLEAFNVELRKMPSRELENCAHGITWRWSGNSMGFDHMLPAILLDCAELLTSGRTERLRVCGAKDCGWLFLDSSKNGKRRWCNMSDCGNREKQRNFQAKARK